MGEISCLSPDNEVAEPHNSASNESVIELVTLEQPKLTSSLIIADSFRRNRHRFTPCKWHTSCKYWSQEIDFNDNMVEIGNSMIEVASTHLNFLDWVTEISIFVFQAEFACVRVRNGKAFTRNRKWSISVCESLISKSVHVKQAAWYNRNKNSTMTANEFAQRHQLIEAAEARACHVSSWRLTWFW